MPHRSVGFMHKIREAEMLGQHCCGDLYISARAVDEISTNTVLYMISTTYFREQS